MEERPHALLLKFPGTNCDAETARALGAAGFETAVVPITRAGRGSLDGADLVVLSGGFSYGDYVMAGRLAGLETARRLGDGLAAFRDAGGFILGICNGFQILMQLGLLPRGSLVGNTSGRFQCRWVTLQNRAPDSPFLRGLPESFELPIAHAEGRFVTSPEGDAERYVEEGKAALTYRDDVNGSMASVAGLQDGTGRVFGLMPHPERFLDRRHHYDPDWDGSDRGWGFTFFRSVRDAIVGAAAPSHA